MKFGRKLETLRGEEIAVVMIDGYIYRGILSEFDDEMMVLTDVDETNNESMNWEGVEKDLKEDSKKKSSKKDEEDSVIKWHSVALPEVIIRLPMVLRIWPWNILDPEEAERRRKSRAASKPVYFVGGMVMDM